MNILDSHQGQHEVFPVAVTSNNSITPVSSSAHPPQTSRRRARTKEINATSPSPPWPTRELVSKSEEPITQSQTSASSSGISTSSQQNQMEDHTISQSPSTSSRHSHNRSPSSISSAEYFGRRDSVHRSDSSSSHVSGTTQTAKRRSHVPKSPPNTWLQRESNSRIDGQIAASAQQYPDQSRSRSGSVGSPRGASIQLPLSLEGPTQVPASPRGFSGLKRSLSRKSVQSVNDGGADRWPTDPLDPKGSLTPHHFLDEASSSADVIIPHKDKRKLFGKREERSIAKTSDKPTIRRVSSRSFFGGNKDKNQDANRSSDTLSSISSSSTARMELTKKTAGASSGKANSLHQWSRRSRKIATSGQEDDIAARMNTDRFHSEDVHGFTADEDFSDLTPRGEGSQTSSNHFSNGYHESATNGSDLQDKGEGLPKRLSGWLSQMLSNNNGTTSGADERNVRLSASVGPSTIRRKTSALSLKRNDSNERFTSSTSSSQPSGTSGSNVSQPSTSRSRNSGLLSTLSASGRSRADTSSNQNGSLARNGLDRALRYFMDNGDQQQDEGMWLLGVLHGPKQQSLQENLVSEATGSFQEVRPTIEVTNASPNVRGSRSSTLEGQDSSASRRGSDLTYDDATTETSSRGTRDSSPSVASFTTGGSISRSSKGHINVGRSLTPEEDVVVARNPPTPQTTRISKSPTYSNGSSSSAGAATSSNRQIERNFPSTTNSSLASFQADFSSRIWCTYRSHFVPINRDGTISNQAEMAAAEAALAQMSLQGDGREEVRDADTITTRGNIVNGAADAIHLATSQFGQIVSTSTALSQGTLGSSLGIQSTQGGIGGTSSLGDKMGIPNLWSRATAAAQAYGLGGRAGLTTDAGWGCMLRTGQSVLANALLNVHLGRDWRREAKASLISTMDNTTGEDYVSLQKRREDYAKYVQLLSWFMDEPSLACPFGIHRMAREGKRLGKEVGEWFGPSTAAGAIKKLVDDYPEAGIGVSLASDGVIYLDQVKSQAQWSANGKQRSIGQWTRPVLVLIGVRLGLDGVHPMYHDSIKATFSFSQSVGIAGGRPSSSYYFMGYQGNSLFYLDPHHVRSSVSFRHPPPTLKDDTDWWLQAYSESELSTFHNDRPRRMPMKSLDPSMLLGFLISNEDSLQDFVLRVKALPRPIFSVLESMPKWMMEDENAFTHDEEKALESFSESSLEDGLMREEEVGAMETPLGVEEEVQDNQRRALNHSILSNSTTTPRSESTFEFVDRQAGLSPRRPSGLVEVAKHHEQSAEAAFTSNQSIADSDDCSQWEDVGIDSSQRKEVALPDGASSPQPL